MRAPPYKDWAEHERFLNGLRASDQGEGPDGCPLSDSLANFTRFLQKLDGQNWGTTYKDRWHKYCREAVDYRGGQPNKDPHRKSRHFLRNFVCALYLTQYLLEYEAYDQGLQAPSASSTGAAASGHEGGGYRSWPSSRNYRTGW